MKTASTDVPRKLTSPLFISHYKNINFIPTEKEKKMLRQNRWQNPLLGGGGLGILMLPWAPKCAVQALPWVHCLQLARETLQAGVL